MTDPAVPPVDTREEHAMNRMRVLVTGSRDWVDASAIRLVLASIADRNRTAVLVHGDCRGADWIARDIWCGWGLQDEPHPAPWRAMGKRAGYVRNAEMVSLGADVCLAFIRNGSRGATHTADLAEKAGIPTRRYQVQTHTPTDEGDPR